MEIEYGIYKGQLDSAGSKNPVDKLEKRLTFPFELSYQ